MWRELTKGYGMRSEVFPRQLGCKAWEIDKFVNDNSVQITSRHFFI